jgi:poly(A) polymerase regulatory subunit
MDESRKTCRAGMGQRKLLVMEVKFLSKYAELSRIVVYVGSSPGTHIPFLTELFPSHIFHLYDSRPYEGRYCGKVNIHQKLFTEEECAKYKDQNILFISDIRENINGFKPDEIDEVVHKNMRDQLRWVNMIQPVATMLKFRLPRSMEIREYSYLDGILLHQPWAPLLTHESRLQ